MDSVVDKSAVPVLRGLGLPGVSGSDKVIDSVVDNPGVVSGSNGSALRIGVLMSVTEPLGDLPGEPLAARSRNR